MTTPRYVVRQVLHSMVLGWIAMLGLARAEPPPADAVAVFHQRCARCHGDDGRSDTLTARALKVRPIQNDSKLARLTRADIVMAVKRNAKHAALVQLDDDDLESAALVVMMLARGGQTTGDGPQPRHRAGK